MTVHMSLIQLVLSTNKNVKIPFKLREGREKQWLGQMRKFHVSYQAKPEPQHNVSKPYLV